MVCIQVQSAPRNDQGQMIESTIQLFGSTGRQKDDAYQILYKDGQKVLRDYLRTRHAAKSDIEDIIQIVFVRILNNWDRLRFDRKSAWYAYLKEAARNASYDIRPKEQNEIKVDPPDLRANSYELILRILDQEFLFNVADRVWLGTPPEDSQIRCLAAQFIYVDGKSEESVLRFVTSSRAQSKPKTCQELLEWLHHPWILRKLAYQELHVSNDCLTALILGHSAENTAIIDDYAFKVRQTNPEEFANPNWKWGQVDYIFLRYRYGIPMSLAIGKTKVKLERQEASSIESKCRQAFPFIPSMNNLWQRSENHPYRTEALTENLLWKRLVFEYHVTNCLPQDDIIERISPSAEIAGYGIKNINSWIAKRLREDLTNWLEANS